MKSLVNLRLRRGLSQRALALRAGVAYRTVQLIEAGRHDPRLSTLAKLAKGLGERPGVVERAIDRRLDPAGDTAAGACHGILRDGPDSWKTWLLDFVDAFRRLPAPAAAAEAPPAGTPPRVLALVASTVEALCDEASVAAPWWCAGVPALDEPWFVSGVAALAASALAESPVHFRRRNIFVLGNFLSRA